MKLKKITIITVILGLVAFAAYSAFREKEPKFEYTTVRAEIGDLVQTVSETGTVRASKRVGLSFSAGGKLAVLAVEAGDRVGIGELLAEVDNEALGVSRSQSQANLDASRQNLNKLISGATSAEIAVVRAAYEQADSAHRSAQRDHDRVLAAANENIRQARQTLRDLTSDLPEDMTSAEQAVAAARIALDNARSSYQRAIDNARSAGLISADNRLSAAQAALDIANSILENQNFKDMVSVKDPRHADRARKDYLDAASGLALARGALAKIDIESGHDQVLAVLDQVMAVLGKTFSCLTNTFYALEHTETGSSISQTALDGHKAAVAAQQSAVAAGQSALQANKQALNDAILNYDVQTAAALSGLNSAQAAYNDALRAARQAADRAQLAAEQQISAAESAVSNAAQAVQLAQAQYDKVVAGAGEHDIALAQAQVRQAEAALAAIDHQIANSRLVAPIQGTVAQVFFELGEQAAPGAVVIALLGENDHEIEVLVSEADIAKIKLGDKAGIYMDAFGEDERFRGEVIFIDPAETVIQDVIYYRAKVGFEAKDLPVRSGMTANVVIVTAEKTGVLLAPARSIIDRNSHGRFIRVLENGVLVEKEAVIGLRGDGGMVEVLSGVKAGDEVVTYVRELK